MVIYCISMSTFLVINRGKDMIKDIQINREVVAHRIRHARKHRGLSQSQVCELTGFSKSNLSKYENGHKLMNYTSLYKFCFVVNCTATYILGI